MQIQELFEFIKKENKRLQKRYEGKLNNNNLVLAHTVKLTEELGELCEEVLAHVNLQRQDKLDAKNDATIRDEFADVLIATLILADSMGVNIEKALIDKMARIDERYDK
ncbi:MAG: hypothetical protein GOU99_03865 [Candidatus Altiarchaeota archaeon]|nr:hypothetical protein [Candidatus Altiarchaeota archaeon]